MPTATSRPRRTARITGVLYLVTIVAGVIAQAFISNRLISFSDAAATANNILSRGSLFQTGLTVYLIEMTCQIAMTTLFYGLLKPVSRNIALVATVIGVAGCVIKTVSRLFYIAPVFVLTSHSLTAFTSAQLRAISLILLAINDKGAGVSLGLMGVGALLKGTLIFRSTFLPRFLGVLAIVGSAGWLTFFYLPLGYASFNYVAPIALLAALAEIFWLVVFGVNEERWNEQARI